MPEPTLRLLSLGAGVQSTTLLLLAAEGRLPRLDGAIFSDTQWEPAPVYAHLDRIDREVAQPAAHASHRPTSSRVPGHAAGHRYRIFAITCPFHGNRQWREMRDQRPEEFADAVAFDAAIRGGNARGNANGKPLLGEAYLHRSRLPLDQAPINRVASHEWQTRQTDIFAEIADVELAEDGDPDGCSPWACRSGSAA
jgi:hypothetical protein